MKKLNKILAILTLIAVVVTMGYADKNEAPILVGKDSEITIYPVDYITINSVVMGKQNGDCKADIKDIYLLGKQRSWRDKGGIGFYSAYGKLCRPDSDENQNNKYIIVLTTNFGSYVYEYIYAEYKKADKENKKYILPLIEYKK